jgi:hypothetical protein
VSRPPVYDAEAVAKKYSVKVNNWLVNPFRPVNRPVKMPIISESVEVNAGGRESVKSPACAKEKRRHLRTAVFRFSVR